MLAAPNKDAAALLAPLRIGQPPPHWRRVPVLDGTAFAAAVEAHPPFGRFGVAADDLIRTALATAALPRPTPIAWTRADLDREAALGARCLRRAGLGPRGRSSDTLDGGLVAPGTLAVTDALDALDALALPVGPIVDATALKRAAEVWEIVRPDVVIVDPASLDFLRAADGYPRPRLFVAILTPADAALLAAPPATDLMRILSVPHVGTWIAGECPAHAGLHLAPDEVYAEVVDGRLLLTPLQRAIAPLRVDVELHARIETSPCPCGEATPRIVP
jgi:phenylacetate-coenzyme A ligase PaaK-like adenylate-forming protein